MAVPIVGIAAAPISEVTTKYGYWEAKNPIPAPKAVSTVFAMPSKQPSPSAEVDLPIRIAMTQPTAMMMIVWANTIVYAPPRESQSLAGTVID
jgi:hypothetical protein